MAPKKPTRRLKKPPSRAPQKPLEAPEAPQGPKIFPASPLPQRSMELIPVMDKAEILALQSLATGTANSHQQVMALKLIVERFADYGGVCVNPQEAMAHAGRRFVGVCIVQTLNKVE